MTGNIFSRALMSIFMDKKARAKYDAIQETKKKKRRKAPSSSGKETAQRTPPPPTDDDDILPETLISNAIEAASQELDRKKNLPPDRAALIEHALSIHDQKSAMLDDLPKEQREKLMVMAMHAFGADLDAISEGKPKKRPKKRPKS